MDNSNPKSLLTLRLSSRLTSNPQSQSQSNNHSQPSSSSDLNSATTSRNRGGGRGGSGHNSNNNGRINNFRGGRGGKRGAGAGAVAGSGNSNNTQANVDVNRRNNTSTSNPEPAIEVQLDGNSEQYSKKKKYDGPKFSYKLLYNYITEKKDPDTVLDYINRNLKDWEIFLSSDGLATARNDNLLVLSIQVIAEKVCDPDIILIQNQISVLAKSLGDNLIGKILDKCNDISALGEEAFSNQRNDPKNPMPLDHTPLKLLSNLYTFYNLILVRMPNTAYEFLHKVLLSTFACFQALDITGPEMLKLHSNFCVLKAKYVEIVKKKKEESSKPPSSKRDCFTTAEERKLDSQLPPEDFRTIPIIPSIDEILSKEVTFLRPNKKTGAYNDSNHYLDIQFRLLREDFVRPLKDGIRDFMKNRHDYLTYKKKMPLGNVRIYPDVLIIGAKLEKDVLIYNIKLPEIPQILRIKWDKSKRLLFGSLLVFTSNNFESASFALVTDRNVEQLTKRKLIGVTWEGNCPEFDRDQKFLMVECEVYFEAFRYNLQRLKEIELETFPMQKFIVEASNQIGAPSYLQETKHLLNLKTIQVNSLLINPLDLESWPAANELSLDNSQFEAFRSSITKEIAIVQGPPGTGKTFLGLKIAEVFMKNKQIYFPPFGDPGHGVPVLIVCYTNHALDQFMEGILDIYQREGIELPKILRIGGRAKSERLNEFSLVRQRQIAAKMNEYGRTFNNARREAYNIIENAQFERAQLVSDLNSLENLEGIVDFDKLEVRNRIKEEIPQVLQNYFSMPDWFGFTQGIFETRNFSAQRKMTEWFKFKVTSQNRTVEPLLRPQPAPPQPQNREPDDEDIEEYDNIDEIQEDRYNDEIMEVLKKSLKDSVKEKSECIDGLSLSQLESNITKNINNINEILYRNDQMNRQQKVEAVRFIENRNKLLEKKLELLKLILNGIKENRIEMPSKEEVEVLIAQVAFGYDKFENLPKNMRFGLYLYFVEKARRLTLKYTNQANKQLAIGRQQLKEAYNLADAQILRNTEFVGMTTTGAAKYSDLVRIMKSKIVICEEAAEVLESHIVTCLTRHCEHLILIGDHQQLQPSTTVYELSKRYNLNISLFERMLNNNLSCYKLLSQHRMRPEIANLVVGTIYPMLENNDNVYEYSRVRGTNTNLYFISHDKHEKSESDSMSKKNDFEADWIANLCRHFILQGYLPSQITVLTTYLGQMFLLKKKIGENPNCKGVRTAVVDNFQGEENEIILLSLVRSNKENQIGFLKTDNRICVAISRAKQGLFIIGNMDSLSSNSGTWQKIKEKLEDRDEIGPTFKAVCQIHGTTTEIVDSNDFRTKVPEGGCLVPCDAQLGCGHKCLSVCHILDSEHKEYKCKERCEKQCVNQHQCQDKCFLECPKCMIKIMKTLPCNHSEMVVCSRAETEVLCHVMVEKTLGCGHKENMLCFANPDKYKCQVQVMKTMKCGLHQKSLPCFNDASNLNCRVPVEKSLPCGHTQEGHCYMLPEMISCDSRVEKVLPCGHKQQVSCKDKNKVITCDKKCEVRLRCGHACIFKCHVNEDPDHVNYVCKKQCERKCALDIHKCSPTHSCNTKCSPCERMVKKRLDLCGHEADVKCFVDQNLNVQCEFDCIYTLECKHKCRELCFQKPCGPCQEIVKKRSSECGHIQDIKCSQDANRSTCNELVNSLITATCGHRVLVPCRLLLTISSDEACKYCTEPCSRVFESCDHKCSGSCGKCQQGRIHMKCNETCGKQLICGHSCNSPCSKSCPTCDKPCFLKCEHSSCGNKCGVPCETCKEKCTWNCSHQKCSKLCGEICDREPCNMNCPKKLKCGHDCVGFCGEVCPPKCKICDSEELTEIFLGYEDEEDAKFILLEDCGHIIESEGMEGHLKSLTTSEGTTDSQIVAIDCPRCKTVIRQSKRYGNLIKTNLEDVIKIKKKLFGNSKRIKEKQMELYNRIFVNQVWDRYFSVFKDYICDNLVYNYKYLKTGEARKRKPKDNIDEASLNSLKTFSVFIDEACKVLKKSDSGSNSIPVAAAGQNRINVINQRARYGYGNGNMANHAQAQNQELSAENPNRILSTELFRDLEGKYLELFRKLKERGLHLSTVEGEDFGREFGRLYDLQQIYLRRSSPKYTEGKGDVIYNKLIRLIWSPRIYEMGLKDLIKKHLKDLDIALDCPFGVTEQERIQIVAAIGLSPGHWFKCPRGHYYTIGECGGATHEARCIECKSAVGGGGHAIRRDNAHAPEVDGSVRHAWPGGLHAPEPED